MVGTRLWDLPPLLDGYVVRGDNARQAWGSPSLIEVAQPSARVRNGLHTAFIA